MSKKRSWSSRFNSSLQTKTKKKPITGKKWNVTDTSLDDSLNYLTNFNFSYQEQDTFITGRDQTSFSLLVFLYNAFLFTILFFFWATYEKDFSYHKKGTYFKE